nr:hypothetical protein GCM10020063_049790 [Dactylosporangium thailandense]
MEQQLGELLDPIDGDAGAPLHREGMARGLQLDERPGADGLRVDVGYTGSSVHSQPKYGGSCSRPGVVHRSSERAKLGLLSETHTVQTKSCSASCTGMTRRPWTKKCSASMMPMSLSSMLRSSPARPSCQGAGASEPYDNDRPSCRSPQQRHM